MGNLETLREENAALRKQVERLIEQVARLTERIAELLPVAQRSQRKPAPERPPMPAPPVDAEARRAFEERPKAPPKPVEKPTSKTASKPTGRSPVPSHLRAEKHELRPDACADCGATTALDVVDKLVEEKLHVVKEH